MRISQDRHSWKAGGILRRDFRAAHGEPEVPPYRAKRIKHSTAQCRRSTSGVHEPERFVTRVTRRPVMRSGEDYVWIVTYWGYRCRHCHTTDIAAKLLAPVADLINTRDLSRLLEIALCSEGHLYETRELDSNFYWGRSRIRRVCVMCGQAPGEYSRYPSATPELLRRAGISEELIGHANFEGHTLWGSSRTEALVDAPKERPIAA